MGICTFWGGHCVFYIFYSLPKSIRGENDFISIDNWDFHSLKLLQKIQERRKKRSEIVCKVIKY